MHARNIVEIGDESLALRKANITISGFDDLPRTNYSSGALLCLIYVLRS